MPLGGRLLIRSKKDWRTAVVSRVGEDRIMLSVASPTGRNYWLGRDPELPVNCEHDIHFLCDKRTEEWRDNFSAYDPRW